MVLELLLCILSGMLAILLGFQVFQFSLKLRRFFKNISIIRKTNEEISFLEGKSDFPNNKIQRKFLDVTLLYRVEFRPDYADMTKIFDISNYEKNNVIGLIYFVQKQTFDDLIKMTRGDAVRDSLIRRIQEQYGVAADEEVIEDLMQQAEALISQEERMRQESGLIIRPLIPHCTVYQLKDGRWVWRPESK